MTARSPTPDVLGNLLGPLDNTVEIRAQLRYDYDLIPEAQRSQVRNGAVDIVRHARKAQESLLVIGQRLIEIKEVLDYGQFSDWCTAEFDMSQRTAQNMMNVAKMFGKETKLVSFLSDTALYLLAAPSTPEAARDAVIAEAQATGASPTKARVQEVIAGHQPYQQIWQLQQSVLAYVRGVRPGAIGDQIDLAKTLPWMVGGDEWKSMTDTLPRPWHVGDVKQACNNAVDELRQDARRTTPAAGSVPSNLAMAAADRDARVATTDNHAYAVAAGLVPADTLPGGNAVDSDAPAGKPMLAVFLAAEQQAAVDVEREVAERELAADEAARQFAAEQQAPAKLLVDWTDADWAAYNAKLAAAGNNGRVAVPVANVVDADLYESADAAYSADTLKSLAKIRKPFSYANALWTCVGGASQGTHPESDEKVCLRIHTAGEYIAPGERISMFMPHSYAAGTQVKCGVSAYVLGAQWMVVRRGPTEALTTTAVDLAIDSDTRGVIVIDGRTTYLAVGDDWNTAENKQYVVKQLQFALDALNRARQFLPLGSDAVGEVGVLVSDIKRIIQECGKEAAKEAA